MTVLRSRGRRVPGEAGWGGRPSGERQDGVVQQPDAAGGLQPGRRPLVEAGGLAVGPRPLVGPQEGVSRLRVRRDVLGRDEREAGFVAEPAVMLDWVKLVHLAVAQPRGL